jgi:hypothetical protein
MYAEEKQFSLNLVGIFVDSRVYIGALLST